MNYPWLEGYLQKKPGVTKDFKEEWGWHRYKVGEKMFAALLHPSEKYDALYAGKDLITVKCAPEMAPLLREKYPEILAGFYMDKRSWNSIDLNGDLPEEVLREMIDESYRLVFEKLTKKLQREILEQNAGQ